MNRTSPSNVGRFVPGLALAIVVAVVVVIYQGQQPEPEPALLQNLQSLEEIKSEQNRTTQDILRLQGDGLAIVSATYRPSNNSRGVVVDLRLRNTSTKTKDTIPVQFRWRLSEDSRQELSTEIHRPERKLAPGQDYASEVVLPLTENQTVYIATSESVIAEVSVNSVDWIAAKRQP